MSNPTAGRTEQSQCQTAVEFLGQGRFLLKCPSEMAWRARVELVDSLTAATGGQTPIDLILDLGGVDFLNSAGIGAVFSIRKHVVDRGGRVVACGARPVIRRLLATVNLPALVPTLDDVSSACGFLDAKGDSEP